MTFDHMKMSSEMQYSSKEAPVFFLGGGGCHVPVKMAVSDTYIERPGIVMGLGRFQILSFCPVDTVKPV